MTQVNTKIFYDKNHSYTSYFDRIRFMPNNEKEKDATAFFEHNFPGEDHTLRVEFNVASSKENESQLLQERLSFSRNQYYAR
jgi:hypothetical protein